MNTSTPNRLTYLAAFAGSMDGMATAKDSALLAYAPTIALRYAEMVVEGGARKFVGSLGILQQVSQSIFAELTVQDVDLKEIVQRVLRVVDEFERIEGERP